MGDHSRRRLGPLASLVTAAATAACAGSANPDPVTTPASEPTPTPVVAGTLVVSAPEREAARVGLLAADFVLKRAPGVALDVRAAGATPDPAAHLTVYRAEPDDVGATAAHHWTLLASPLAPPQNIDLQSLRALYLDGTPVGGFTTLLVADLPVLDPFDPGVGAPRHAVAVPMAELAGRVLRDPAVLGLVPAMADWDPRLVPLGVTGWGLLPEGNLWLAPVQTRVRFRVAEGEGPLHGLARELAEHLREAMRASSLPTPTIVRFTGDVIPARCAYARMRELGDMTSAFRSVASTLDAADIAAGSLDAAVSDAGTPIGCERTFSLLAPEAAMAGLTRAGYDVITVATNHAKDCGASACGDAAFLDTLANLRAAGIAPVGGGATLAEARAPAIIEAGRARFAFLGYDAIAPYYHAGEAAPGTAPLREDYVREDVARAREVADVVIVMPHWGVEYTASPTASQRQMARAAVEAGATLVVGNHPHWVQANEMIGGAFVAYALGNFVFDQTWSVETQQGAMLEAVFWGAKLRGVRYLPVRIEDSHRPVLAGGAEGEQIMRRIWDATFALR